MVHKALTDRGLRGERVYDVLKEYTMDVFAFIPGRNGVKGATAVYWYNAFTVWYNQRRFH